MSGLIITLVTVWVLPSIIIGIFIKIDEYRWAKERNGDWTFTFKDLGLFILSALAGWMFAIFWIIEEGEDLPIIKISLDKPKNETPKN